MLRVKLSLGVNDPVIRQTPGRSGIWEDVEFVTDDDQEGPFHCWIVLEAITRPLRAACGGGSVAFVTFEPPSIRGYDRRFLEQFTTLLTFRTDLRHPNRVRSHPLLPWWIGTRGGHVAKAVVRDYDELKGSFFPPKHNAVSVVCSDKAVTEDHRRRLHFVRALQEPLGDALHVFGPGFRPWPDEWPDKWDQIVPYRYHLALENSSLPDYWTEKVADTFLGGAFLIYWGCPNLHEYFPRESFLRVDRDDPVGTTAAISKLLESSDLSDSELAVAESRSLVLDRYNLFAELARFARSVPQHPMREVRLQDEARFVRAPSERLKRFARRQFARLGVE